jgi:hypothetical protein
MTEGRAKKTDEGKNKQRYEKSMGTLWVKQEGGFPFVVIRKGRRRYCHRV